MLMKQTASKSNGSRKEGEWANSAPNSPERGLLPRLATGGPEVFEECIEAYGAWIWAIARRFTETNVDAEAATLDIFECIRKQAPRFQASKLSETDFISVLAASCMTKYARSRGYKIDRYL